MRTSAMLSDNRAAASRTGLRALRAFTVVVFAGLFATACDRKSPITETNDILGITITPNPTTLAATSTRQFTAVGSNAFTGKNQQITPVWTVLSGGGTITSTGLFTAGPTPGTYTNTVQAAAQGRTATATVTVTVGPLATITVTPNPQTLAPGALQQFAAVGRDAAGNIVSFSPVWSVSTAGGGTINNAGMFTAGNTAGTFTNTVVASSGSITGTATVTVSPGPLTTITVTPSPATLAVGATQQFTAVGRDANGNAVLITPTWSVAAGGGTINSTGLHGRCNARNVHEHGNRDERRFLRSRNGDRYRWTAHDNHRDTESGQPEFWPDPAVHRGRS